MNLKDRLENIKSANILSIKEEEEYSLDFDVEQVFLDSDEVKSVLIQTIDEGKNILFVSKPTIETSLIFNYFQKLFSSSGKHLSFNKDLLEENKHYESKISFISSTSIGDFVRILEKIMYGFRTCVLGIKLKNFDYALDKIKVAIALNSNNLSEENIEILLGTSDLILVNFDKNSDGLYFVSKIDKVTFENYKTGTLTLFDSVPNVVESKIEEQIIQDVVQNDIVEESVLEKQEEIELNIVDEIEVEKEEVLMDDPLQEEKVVTSVVLEEDIKEETTKKRNKYSVLKEKVRRKKMITQE